MPPHDQFRYDGFAIDAAASAVVCRYSTSTHGFVERFTFPSGGDWEDPAVRAAVRILYLLGGVSYYKTSAPPSIDLGDLVSTEFERAFLRRYYVHGLGEFAFRNGLDLGQLRVSGPDGVPARPPGYDPVPGRPLIPFGGGIDSIVSVESIVADHPDAALCVVAPPGDRFAAIEGAAAVTGLPVTRISREIDPLVRRSRVGVPQRSCTRHRGDHRGQRGGRGPPWPRRRGPLQRMVGLGAHARVGRTRREPPVVQG